MGGANSEVSESTTTVLVECASWDPPTIMAMSRRHGLRSEASSRFERGVDPNLPPLAADRMAELIALVAGGTVVGGTVDVYPSSRRATPDRSASVRGPVASSGLTSLAAR